MKPCDPARFLFSSFDLLARSKEIWMSSALSTRNTWRPSPLEMKVICRVYVKMIQIHCPVDSLTLILNIAKESEDMGEQLYLHESESFMKVKVL